MAGDGKRVNGQIAVACALLHQQLLFNKWLDWLTASAFVLKIPHEYVPNLNNFYVKKLNDLNFAKSFRMKSCVPAHKSAVLLTSRWERGFIIELFFNCSDAAVKYNINEQKLPIFIQFSWKGGFFANAAKNLCKSLTKETSEADRIVVDSIYSILAGVTDRQWQPYNARIVNRPLKAFPNTKFMNNRQNKRA